MRAAANKPCVGEWETLSCSVGLGWLLGGGSGAREVVLEASPAPVIVLLHLLTDGVAPLGHVHRERRLEHESLKQYRVSFVLLIV